MLSPDTWQERQVLRELEELAGASDRFVDFGAVLHVVERDPGGQQLLPGSPPLKILRSHRFGGVIDTKARPVRWVGPSRDPVVWFCSEAQEPLILHDDHLPLRLLVWGAEGAGKTDVLALWLAVQAMRFTGADVEIGATAPTTDRLEMVQKALRKKMPERWFSWSERHQRFTLANRVKIQLVGTHRHSEAVGERIQGYNWAACASDELQDSSQEADDGIEMRGRTAPGGKYRRLATSSVKDSTSWRNRRAKMEKTGMWGSFKLPGMSNPFVWPRFWEDKKKTLSERAYRRRVLAEDVGPERATYPAWLRERNLRPIPLVGSVDVTADVLFRVNGVRGQEMLIGHDPGELFDVSIGLKAFRVPGLTDPVWWAVYEHTTSQTTTEEHVASLLRDLSERWSSLSASSSGVVGRLKNRPDVARLIHVRCDPYGENDTRPDKSVYAQWRRAGVHIKSAAYKNGQGSGRVPKEARIEMVNRLLCNAARETRLIVACDELGQPHCPELVRSLESSERDELGRAETQKKNIRDVSHWTCALGYGLWRFERIISADDMWREAK